MVNIERVNLKYKKNLGRSFLILMVMLIIIGCVIFIQYKNKIEDTLKEEAAITLEIISAQNATNIRMNISHKQKLLHLIAKIIEESKELRPEKVVELLRRYNNFSGADDIGIIDANGIAYTVQGEKLDVSEYQYFTQAMKGLGGLSKDYISKDKKEMFIISTVPIYIQDKVEMVLMATYEQSHFTRLIDQPFFDGEGKCLVMDFEGNLLTQENELHEMNKEFIWEHIQQHYS